MKRLRLCFVVNPLAGLGGPLGLKGSDLDPEELLRLSDGHLVAPERARRFARRLAERLPDVQVYTADGLMGRDEAEEAGLKPLVVYTPSAWPTRREDTAKTVRRCLTRNVDVVVFVGGDGTARDVYRGLGGSKTPILGVPAGVKVYSSVFAVSPEAAADLLAAWDGSVCSTEIVDIDENMYRHGRLAIRLYAIARTPCGSLLVGSSKQPSPQSPEEEENRRAIARYLAEQLAGRSACTLLVLGPGTTVAAVAEELGLRGKTLLGVDVAHGGRILYRDVDEETLYRLVLEHRSRGGRVAIILTPIGGQGFILGRGNQQISPRVVRAAGGKEALIVVATRYKMEKLRWRLRVDTGDPVLDSELAGYIRVIVDYGEEAVVPVEAYIGGSGARSAGSAKGRAL